MGLLSILKSCKRMLMYLILNLNAWYLSCLTSLAKNYKPILISNMVKRYGDNDDLKHKKYLYWSMYNVHFIDCEFLEFNIH